MEEKRLILRPWANTACYIIEGILFFFGVGLTEGMELRDTIPGILFNGTLGILCILAMLFVIMFRQYHSKDYKHLD